MLVLLVGVVSTTSTSSGLTLDPSSLDATTWYVAASASDTALNEKLAVVAPGIAIPFFRHWKVGAGVPSAVAMNVTLVPTRTASAALTAGGHCAANKVARLSAATKTFRLRL